jgi:predicted nucleic acid-binding protein
VRKILLDTNAYVAFKRGDAATLDVLRHAPTIGLSVVVLGELLAGFAGGARAARNRTELAAFLDSPRVRVHPVGHATADCYATIFASLRRRGRPIPTNDLWIAATALEHGYALCTFDRHFEQVENLPLGRVLSDFHP